MKRIAVITIHAIRNYGSVLQAYATQEIIKKLNYLPQIIDYKYPNPIHQQQLSVKGNLLKYANRLLMFLLGVWPKFKKREKSYQEFIDTKMNLTSHYATREQLLKNPPDADIYLSGSDQIWHPRCIDYDLSFLLDFVPKCQKKVAFASSFGVNSLSRTQSEIVRNSLSAFHSIAVRESSAQDLINELIGKKPQLVLDPTLLLSAEEWEQVERPLDIKKPYILLYGNLAGQGQQMDPVALSLKQQTGYDIIRIHGKAYHRFSRKIRYRFDVGPFEFLWLFRNASFILANSFHGTVFSILFKRQFLSFYPAQSDFGSRQRNILKLLDLQNRGVELPVQSDAKTFAQLMQQPYAHDKVQNLLTELRGESLLWLKETLK